MCYEVYISTDYPVNLAERSSTLVRFEKIIDPEKLKSIEILDFPNKWYVGSLSGCSCTFRHLMSVELGFMEPVDWFEEEQDNIDATRELYKTLSFILSSGYRLDLLDRWYEDKPEVIKTIDVSLDEVSETTFRLFEKHKFRLKK